MPVPRRESLAIRHVDVDSAADVAATRPPIRFSRARSADRGHGGRRGRSGLSEGGKHRRKWPASARVAYTRALREVHSLVHLGTI